MAQQLSALGCLRGPEFKSQHLHGDSSPPVTPVSRESHALFGPQWTPGMQVVHTQTYQQSNYTNEIKLIWTALRESGINFKIIYKEIRNKTQEKFFPLDKKSFPCGKGGETKEETNGNLA